MRCAVLFFGFLLAASAALANPKPLGLWIQEFRAEARRFGVSDNTLDAAFRDFALLPKVIELDRRQPESTRSFTQYMESAVSASRVSEGRRLLQEHRVLLEKIGAEYGVPAKVIVALWGIETSYGKVTGSFNVPHALATLAYEGRRADFFRGELLNALRIVDQGHIVAASMEGSWAGAMGQSQFMPSSFLSYAVDYDGDGRRDIWTTRADVFASVANYLKQSGWNPREGILTGAALPAKFDARLENIDRLRPLSEWRKLGVAPVSGIGGGRAALVFPGKPYEGAYLVSPNYHVILKWNRSRYFATAVGILAERIGDGK